MTSTLPPLYSKIVNLLPPGRHNYVSPAAVIAVCLQESNGSPTFLLSDAQCKDNLKAAMAITTLPQQLLIDALTIKSGVLAGQIAKFRCEPGYWEWTATKQIPSVSLRFLCSCSIGIGQQMIRWVLPATKDAWDEFVESFKTNVDIQLEYLIKALEKLLGETEGDLFKAYKGYNSGDIYSTNPDVIERAKHVVALRDKAQLMLQG